MRKRICFFIEVVIVMTFVVGCSLFGGSSVSPVTKPVAKLETELETAKEDIDKSKNLVEAIDSKVNMWEQRISTMETNLTTIQNQISIVQSESTQYNESLKSIMWTLAGIWGAIKVLAFLQMIVAAKLMPGKTIKNVFTLPWEKK